MYPTLKTWAPELKVFYNKQHYPGSWNGVDKHGNDRELLKMNYEELPFAVREWIKKHPKQRHFSVQGDVVFFAPGAIYPILPLFVDESEEGSDCDSEAHIPVWPRRVADILQVSWRIWRITLPS